MKHLYQRKLLIIALGSILRSDQLTEVYPDPQHIALMVSKMILMLGRIGLAKKKMEDAKKNGRHPQIIDNFSLMEEDDEYDDEHEIEEELSNLTTADVEIGS